MSISREYGLFASSEGDAAPIERRAHSQFT